MANFSEPTPSMSQESHVPQVSLGIQIVEVGILLLIIPFGLLGNLCVCLMIYRTKQLQTVSNFLVVNLSITDLMRVLLSLTVSTGVLIKRAWLGSDVFCQINAFYTLVLLSSSLLSVTLISINRYFLVVKPNKAKNIFSKRNAKALIILLWFLSLVTALPPLFGLGRYGFIAARATCFIALGSTDSYTTVLVIVLIAVPFSVMIWGYIGVYLAILRSKKRVQSTAGVNNAEQTSQRSSQLSKEMKVAQTVLVLVGVYIITWIPISVLHFIRMSRATHVPYHVDLAAGFLISLSCVTNPWIYGSKHKQFYSQLRRMFCHMSCT